MTTPLLSLHQVSRRFPGVAALVNVDLEIFPGTIHALVGENGAGKSTLIHILSGVLRPDSGRIVFRGHEICPRDPHHSRALGIATVHQEADLFPDLNIAENFAFEQGWPCVGGIISSRILHQRATRALALMGSHLDPLALGQSLTAAQRQVVGLAAGLTQEASLLILDEPTSSLSAAESARLFSQLLAFREQGGAVLYVTHRMEEIFKMADRATVLRDGRRVWCGPIQETNPTHLVAQMVGRPQVMSERRPGVPGAIRLACRELQAADGSFTNVTLEAHGGQILGVYGLVGAGRSEWAQAILGLRALSRGSLEVEGKPWTPKSPGQAAKVGIAYLPEDRLRMGIFPGLSVQANVTLAALRHLAHGLFLPPGKETALARKQTQALAVRLRTLLQPMATLSGGNQQKVVLGRWLACDPKILILDEPTRGIDVGARAEIHDLLRQLAQSGAAIVLISSDLPEIFAISDRICVFRTGRVAAVLPVAEATAENVAAAALPEETKAEANPTPVLPPPMASGPRSRTAGLLAASVLLALFLAFRTETFLTLPTLTTLAEDSGLLVLCGLGAALVILVGGIDISFGSIMALSAALTGDLMRSGWPVPVAIALGLLTGTGAGALNAIVSLLGRVHPIVVTLGALSLFRGLTMLLIGSNALYDVPDAFRVPWQSSPLGIPTLAWLALTLTTLAWFLLSRTVAGRQVFALGSNPRAAARVGIPRGRLWIIVFALQGFLAAVAGLSALALVGRLQSTDFEEKTLEAIGVAVVGGIAVSGGRGSLWGVWAAALLFRLLDKGWVLLHVSRDWQRAVVGGLLLLAILSDQLWRRKHEEE